MNLRGSKIPCVTLGEVLGIATEAVPEEARYLLIKLAGGDAFALGVDRVIDHEDLVVSPLPPLLMQVGFYVGSTLLDDGMPITMLDVAGVARAAGMTGEVRHLAVREDDLEAFAENSQQVSALLFVGFDGAERAIEMDEVRRIEKLPASALRRGLASEGAQVVIDRRIVPVTGLGQADPGGHVALFCIGEGDGEVAHAHARMIDIVTFDHASVVDSAGERIALIDGRRVALLSAKALRESPARQIICQD